jgi:hypothetical protein
MANSNLVDLPVELNSRLQQDYGSKTKERKNSDTNSAIAMQCSSTYCDALSLRRLHFAK